MNYHILTIIKLKFQLFGFFPRKLFTTKMTITTGLTVNWLFQIQIPSIYNKSYHLIKNKKMKKNNYLTILPGLKSKLFLTISNSSCSVLDDEPYEKIVIDNG